MKILIADDHWIVRETLKQVVKQVGRMDEILEASTFGEVMKTIDAQPAIGLILVDLIMPDFEAFEGLKALRRRVPHVPVVVISVHENREYVLKAIGHGVVGYIPKTAPPGELLSALKLVLEGHVSFPRHILQQAPDEFAVQPGAAHPSSASAPPVKLTEREDDVLALLGQGTTVSEIAQTLSLSPHTIRVHISNMMHRLGIGNRTALIHYAVNRKQGIPHGH